jgi:hypothetical protein
MSSSAEQAEIDALIDQLSPSHDSNKKNEKALSSSPDANSASTERKHVYIRQNSGPNSNVQLGSSPSDAHRHLLQKNVKISKKNGRKSRQGLFERKK